MATDEEGDTGSDSHSGLKELFSMGEDGEEGDEESSEKTPAEGPTDAADTESGETTAETAAGTAEENAASIVDSPPLDDAEILTDADDGNESDEGAERDSVPERSAESEVSEADSAADDGTTGADDTASTTQSPTNEASTVPAEQSVEGDAEILSDRPSPEPPGPEAGNGDEETAIPRSATNRLTTGITMLDRELEGGIPPGRMLSLVAPPETQSELIVKEMAVSRPTVYISTFRPEWEIREELHDHLQKTEDEGLIDNDLEVSYVDPERLLADPMEYIGNLPKGSNLIIDSINEFELEDRRRYVEFLNTVKEVLWDTGSVGLFYGIEEATDPPARSLTLKRSDLVWQLQRSVRTNEIQTSLLISKFRGGKALTEPVKLVLTDDVQVDMSRDIG